MAEEPLPVFLSESGTSHDQRTDSEDIDTLASADSAEQQQNLGGGK